MAVVLFAGVFVRDHDVARSWYTRLLGAEPSFLASPTESVWELAEHCWLYTKRDPGRAGYAEQTVFVDDLDARVAAAEQRGVHPDRHETYPGGVRKVVFRDVDGNEIGLGGQPD
ncbi:VOC family protein [Actinomycetospora sp. CA-101289]|uniref:VOC family protein n=1 Tax=Actinomycetospora sp. CA-101289 TaxID=3239893 RepID=UPI003D99F0E3